MNGPKVMIESWWRKSQSAAVELLFPPRCGCCDADAANAGDAALVCDACRGQLALIDWPVCPRCAALVPTAGGVVLSCMACRGVRLRFDRTLAMGSYEGLLRHWITRMKEDRMGLAARALSDLAWERLGAELAQLGADVVTAVPMRAARRWRRGVNQPAAIAERLARKLGLPAAPGMLRFKRNVPPQLGLSRAGRFSNMAGEMALQPGYSLQAAHVLLVDDILTTGATASEASRALKKAGAATVSVLVLARTPAGD